MSAITTEFGTGGANLTPNYSSGAVDVTTAIREVYDDIAALRAAIVGITAKLDAEDVVAIDTDYATVCDPPALVSAQVALTFGTGGANLTPNNSAGTPWLTSVLRDAADDLANLRVAFVTLTAKLDADDPTNMDNDYASLWDPAAMKTIKG